MDEHSSMVWTMWRGLRVVNSNPVSVRAKMQDHKSRSSELFVHIWQHYKAVAVSSNGQKKKFDRSNSMWHQHDSRNVDVIPPGTAQPVPFLQSNPLIKLWNRFGLHHDSMQSGTEQGSIISWRTGVRGCVSLHAGAVLCQETSRFASPCCPGLHGSPEGNLIQPQEQRGKSCSKGATNLTTPFQILTYLTEHQCPVT